MHTMRQWMTLCEVQTDRDELANQLGYTVNAYHGTSQDFDAFRHTKKAHFGFHFGSTPAAAEQKLKADRNKENPSIKRGADALAVYDPDERDAALSKLRQQHAAISKALNAVNMTIYSRKPPRTQAEDDALLAALERDDDAEIRRLLALQQPEPTSDDTTQIKDLRDRLDAIERRMSLYFSYARPGERIIPVKLRLQNPIRMKDTNWGDPQRIAADNRDLRLPSNSLAAIRQTLERRGHDGVVYRNEVEDVGADSYIVFSPNQVRSRFARFDPKKVGSGNMMESY